MRRWLRRSAWPVAGLVMLVLASIVVDRGVAPPVAAYPLSPGTMPSSPDMMSSCGAGCHVSSVGTAPVHSWGDVSTYTPPALAPALQPDERQQKPFLTPDPDELRRWRDALEANPDLARPASGFVDGEKR